MLTAFKQGRNNLFNSIPPNTEFMCVAIITYDNHCVQHLT